MPNRTWEHGHIAPEAVLPPWNETGRNDDADAQPVSGRLVRFGESDKRARISRREEAGRRRGLVMWSMR
jgi:hypothetical protein